MDDAYTEFEAGTRPELIVKTEEFCEWLATLSAEEVSSVVTQVGWAFCRHCGLRGGYRCVCMNDD